MITIFGHCACMSICHCVIKTHCRHIILAYCSSVDPFPCRHVVIVIDLVMRAPAALMFWELKRIDSFSVRCALLLLNTTNDASNMEGTRKGGSQLTKIYLLYTFLASPRFVVSSPALLCVLDHNGTPTRYVYKFMH